MSTTEDGASIWAHNADCGGSSVSSRKQRKTYQTYTKTNAKTGEVYSGRTSGTGTPLQNVARRDRGHQKNSEGFGEAGLDKSSSKPNAIRGREQQLIEYHGGARSQGGRSGNHLNGISGRNRRGKRYLAAASEEFGTLPSPGG